MLPTTVVHRRTRTPTHLLSLHGSVAIVGLFMLLSTHRAVLAAPQLHIWHGVTYDANEAAEASKDVFERALARAISENAQPKGDIEATMRKAGFNITYSG